VVFLFEARDQQDDVSRANSAVVSPPSPACDFTRPRSPRSIARVATKGGDQEFGVSRSRVEAASDDRSGEVPRIRTPMARTSVADSGAIVRHSFGDCRA